MIGVGLSIVNTVSGEEGHFGQNQLLLADGFFFLLVSGEFLLLVA